MHLPGTFSDSNTVMATYGSNTSGGPPGDVSDKSSWLLSHSMSFKRIYPTFCILFTDNNRAVHCLDWLNDCSPTTNGRMAVKALASTFLKAPLFSAAPLSACVTCSWAPSYVQNIISGITRWRTLIQPHPYIRQLLRSMCVCVCMCRPYVCACK